MSRTGAGVYSLPPGSTFVSGTVIDEAVMNTLLTDLETDANLDRPVTAGGTGASTVAAAQINLGIRIDTRTAFAAATVPSTINIVETGGYSTYGDGGAATYKRKVSEPSHALKVNSADGAWWEIVTNTNTVTFQASGGIEGNSAANGAANVTAFDNFIDYAQTFTASGAIVSGPVLLFPLGHYHFNAHLNVKAAITMRGSGVFSGGVRVGSILEFASNKNGIIVHSATTIDETVEASSFQANGTIIENLQVTGGGASDSTGHGIWLRATAKIRNCRVQDFGLDGVHIVADVGGGGATEGNANQWGLEDVTSASNGRHGFYVASADVNAGAALRVDATSNARWGILDNSFLGNTWLGCHSTNNGGALTGNNAADESCFVSYDSKRYSANVGATEDNLKDTTPGTDATVWILKGSGGVASTVPLWVASKPSGTYFHGGAYRAEGSSNNTLFSGCYTEGNQGEPQIDAPSQVMGGTFGNNKGTKGFHMKGTTGGVEVVGPVKYDNFGTWHEVSTRDPLMLEFNPAADVLIRARPGVTSTLDLLVWNETLDAFYMGQWNGSGSLVPMILTSDTTTLDAGRSSTLPGGQAIFPQGFAVGDSRSNARYITNGTAAPTGDKAKGEIVLNRNAGSGSPWAWQCTTGHASTPTFTTVYGIGTQQSNIVDASTSHALNSTFSDTEVETALDALGTKINGLIAAMEHFGFTST